MFSFVFNSVILILDPGLIRQSLSDNPKGPAGGESSTVGGNTILSIYCMKKYLFPK